MTQEHTRWRKLFNKIFPVGSCLSSLGLTIWAIIEIMSPASQSDSQLPWDLVPLLVAGGFWFAGLAFWKMGQQPVFRLFFFLTSAMLPVGLLSGYGNDLAGRLFYILLAWMAPVLIHFHQVWATLLRRRLVKASLTFFYCLALAWSLPFVLSSIAELQKLGWFPFLRFGVRFTAAFSLVVVILLVIGQFRRTTDQITRYRIRLVFSGTVLAFAPLLFLFLLPSLFGTAFIPHEVNLAWLLLIPLTYGFSIASPYTGRIEGLLNRGIVYYLAAVLFAGGYLVAADVLIFFKPEWANFWAWMIAGLSLGLLFLLARVSQLLRNTANWMLYGSEKSQLQVLAKITDALGLVMDRERLREILVDELAATFPISGAALLLKARDSYIRFQSQTGFDWLMPVDFSIAETSSLAAMLKDKGAVVENETVHKALAQADLTDEERQLLLASGIELWIPLVSGNEMYGLLVLGSKPGRVLYTVRDRQVWWIFAHQAGVAAHNLLLAEDLQTSRAELARAHQQLLYAREQERHQIACELHDNAVQQLLGASYQVVTLQQQIRHIKANGNDNFENIDPGLDALRQEILRVTTQLRDLIGELRPPGLEEFGLGSALEGFVHKVQRQSGRSGPQIELIIELNDTQIPEAVGICLFRISQEALRNCLKHASAQRIQMHLSGSRKEVRLEIVDDGCGFTVPNCLSELIRANHFGLVGMAERVDWANGQISVLSQPGRGTRILVGIPLENEL